MQGQRTGTQWVVPVHDKLKACWCVFPHPDDTPAHNVSRVAANTDRYGMPSECYMAYDETRNGRTTKKWENKDVRNDQTHGNTNKKEAVVKSGVLALVGI